MSKEWKAGSRRAGRSGEKGVEKGKALTEVKGEYWKKIVNLEHRRSPILIKVTIQFNLFINHKY